MFMSQKTPDLKVTPERIEEIMKAAHRERNEAIAQLFGFGFTVLKDTVSNRLGRHGLGRHGLGHKAEAVGKPVGGSACG